MASATVGRSRKGRRVSAAVFFCLALLALGLAGCVSNDENWMPWAAPDPNDASVNLPGPFSNR